MIPRVRKNSILMSILVLVLFVTISHYLSLIMFKLGIDDVSSPKLHLDLYNISGQNAIDVYSHVNVSVHDIVISSPVIVHNTPSSQVPPQGKVDPRHLITCGELGQLGNAMFQYAGLLGVAKTNDRNPVVRPQYQLTSIFKLTHLRDVDSNHNWTVVGEAAYGRYDPSLESLPSVDILLSAYLQSYKYFHRNSEEIKKEFTFQDHIKQEAESIMTSLKPEIKERLPVGVHVRRGDKLLFKDHSAGDMVASDSYFEKSFQEMRARYGDVVFLVATDDVMWCQNTFRNKSDVIILPPAPREVHLCLLSICRHVIMSVGTFGWWGGWLAGGDVMYYKYQVRDGSPRAPLFNITDFVLPQWRGIGD